MTLGIAAALSLFLTGLLTGNVDTSLLFALAGLLGAPMISYLVAARKMSGRIDTTDAAELWKEATKMREEYRGELAPMRDLIARLRETIEEQAEELKAQRAAVESCTRENTLLRQSNEILTKRVAALEGGSSGGGS